MQTRKTSIVYYRLNTVKSGDLAGQFIDHVKFIETYLTNCLLLIHNMGHYPILLTIYFEV